MTRWSSPLLLRQGVLAMVVPPCALSVPLTRELRPACAWLCGEVTLGEVCRAGRFRPWLPSVPGGLRILGAGSKGLQEQRAGAEARLLEHLQQLM